MYYTRLLGLMHLIVYSSVNSVTQGAMVSPNLPYDDFYEDGDLILGALLPLRQSTRTKPCGGPLFKPAIQMLHIIRYILNQTNQRQDILPDVKLGLVALNDCYRPNVGLVRATQYIPNKDICPAEQGNDTSDNTLDLAKGERPSYEVFAVVGSFASSWTVLTASLLGSYDIPQMGWSTTSDELSDKTKYPLFSRIVPPDRFQAKALVDIMVHYGWSYISTINIDETYGRNAMKYVTTFTKEVGICIAHSKELSINSPQEEFDDAVQKLVENSKARVVVTFLYIPMARELQKALARAGKVGHFIFLSTDTFRHSTYTGLEPSFIGTFATQLKTGRIDGFEEYYKGISPWREDHTNPWFGQYDREECTEQFGGAACGNFTSVEDFPNFYWSTYYGAIADVVSTFVNSLHSFIKDHCQDAIGNKSALRSCFDGPKYLSVLRGIDFQGYTTPIKFDANGDILGGYDITYFRGIGGSGYENRKVGNWSREGVSLTLDDDQIVWYGPGEEELHTVPESVCAKPCAKGEFYLRGELECCWECRRCRDNEKIREDQEGCDVCPEMTWPEQDNFTKCESIPPTYMLWSDSLAIGLEALSSIGLFICLLVTIVFIRHRQKKVIRGSSRELMTPITMGIYLAFLIVFLFLSQPQTWACYLNYAGFHLSCTLIFGPLFLKTLRLYRIFKAAERCQQRVGFVNTSSQIVLMLVIIFIQIIILVVLGYLHPPGEIYKMPVSTVKYVELLCDIPLQNLMAPLSYNLLFLLLCAVFGFLTRHLPDNFNESWYIFISVSTTIFVWIAFLSTYLLAFYAYHKAALLSLALILNAAATVICLYVPKIYAVYFVEETKIKTTNFDSLDFSMTTEHSEVAPDPQSAKV